MPLKIAPVFLLQIDEGERIEPRWEEVHDGEISCLERGVNAGWMMIRGTNCYTPFNGTFPGDFSIASEISFKYPEILSASLN